ncbi:hypothetical protein OS31_26840 [Dickeya oryzae]
MLYKTKKNITNEQVCTELVITIHAKTYIPGLIGLAAIIKRSGYEKKMLLCISLAHWPQRKSINLPVHLVK